jgi:LmbE family N-acetylglucosaminyl deacetylase
MERLLVAGTVLYVAAHPDDENTRLIAYLSGERGVRAVYLSMTRGDGGQNLIGAEQDALFGVIRTAELLEARRLDGGEQWFTRAEDFGFSKSAEESLELWGHEPALADVVWAVRLFRPDVIIARFPTVDPQNHGHHVASARLAGEAFTKAADPTAFPEQLAHVEPWQATRLLHNVGTWRLPKDADMSKYMSLDVGVFSPALGASYTEIAARSRSMHKSQGFGAAPSRGKQLEYFDHLAGAPARGDLFDDVDLAVQTRLPYSGAYVEAIREAQAAFRASGPHEALPALAKALGALEQWPESHWKVRKRAELSRVMADCAGLFVEARADAPSAAPGAKVKLTLETLVRTPAAASLLNINLSTGESLPGGGALEFNALRSLEASVVIPASAPPSSPYWMREPLQDSRYTVPEQELRGLPLSPPALWAEFRVEIQGKELTIPRPVVWKWTDPVHGERYRRFAVAPSLTVTPERPVAMVTNSDTTRLRFRVRANTAGDSAAEVVFEAPAGFTVKPARLPVTLTELGAETHLSVEVIKTSRQITERAELKVWLDYQGRREQAFSFREVDYPHIEPQTVFQPSTVALVPLAIAGNRLRVGYIPGAGDDVAQSLSDAGYEVTLLSDNDITERELGEFDAIVTGVRAFNVNARLRHLLPRLVSYAEAGGTVVVQYNTNSWLGPIAYSVGPKPITIGRGRVTREDAPLRPLDPQHRLLRAPNALTDADFQGWVQERGLYFAEKWDPAWTPIFETNDPGEPAQKGALLALDVGKGAFIYTGLSFFRQLPAGVPGAHRLFANLVANGKSAKSRR